MVGEGNKPEMIIPLTNKSRVLQLMFKAQQMMGVAGGTVVVNDTSELYTAMMENNQLLRAIIEKDAAIYLDECSVGYAYL